MTWQPIETAPKDGTEVLGWLSRSIDEQPYVETMWYVPDAEVWVGDYDGCRVLPTHWMPLPEPPA